MLFKPKEERKEIGKVLKTRLIKRFRSIKNIKIANKEDLMTVVGISEKIANIIITELN